MTSPVILFGKTSDEYTNKVFELRKRVNELGYEEKEEDLLIVPHLTFVFNKEFDEEKSESVKKIVADEMESLNVFSLRVFDYIDMEGNIAARFDNSRSSKIAESFTEKLKSEGFSAVITDHMRLIRSIIKPEHVEEVKDMCFKNLPNEIEISGVALSGKKIHKEDFIFEFNF
ncbi:MAG TPA: hypothetical protein VHE53_04195 [Patescibacteria group bacterium]|nr:hypothetical protein [Patescibacteria group bacterium]